MATQKRWTEAVTHEFSVLTVPAEGSISSATCPGLVEQRHRSYEAMLSQRSISSNHATRDRIMAPSLLPLDHSCNKISAYYNIPIEVSTMVCT